MRIDRATDIADRGIPPVSGVTQITSNKVSVFLIAVGWRIKAREAISGWVLDTATSCAFSFFGTVSTVWVNGGADIAVWIVPPVVRSTILTISGINSINCITVERRGNT